MSTEHQQPVVDVPAAEPTSIEPTAVAAEPTTEAEATPATDAVEPVAAAPAVEGQKATEAAAPAEGQGVTEGVLGYKGPGLVKGLRFSKKFFWFSDEAVESSSLTAYVRGEKPEISHHNAAYATQSGKGLLFYAKRAEDKSQPAGIINLGEATDFAKEGLMDFSLKLNGHKHTFQATTRNERDGWYAAVEIKAAEAKSTRDSVVNSEGYKSQLSKFGPPAALAGAAMAAKSVVTPKKHEDKVHDGVGASDATVSSAEPAKDAEKSRSQSRKRQSLFGTLRGKKEEHEEKKEVKAEEQAEKKEVKEEAVEAKAGEPAALGEQVPLDAAAVASRTVGEPVVPAEGVATTEATPAAATETSTPAGPSAAAAPKPVKRASVFGNLFKKDSLSPSGERKEKEVVPAVPAKDLPATTATGAPQLADPVETLADKPAETAAVQPEVATAPKSTAQTEPKGGLFGFIKQKEAQHEEKKEVKNEEKAATEVPAAVTTSETAAPAVTEPTTKEIPTTTTTATSDASKDKRRSSFFASLGKKVDGEGTDAKGEKLGDKIGGIFRKASRSAKPSSSKEPVTDSSAPPAIAAVEKEKEPVVEPPTATEPTEPTAPAAPVATEALDEKATDAATAPTAHAPAVSASA